MKVSAAITFTVAPLYFAKASIAPNERAAGKSAGGIQGTEEQIERVITAIEKGTFIHIEYMDVKNVPIVPEEHFFITKG